MCVGPLDDAWMKNDFLFDLNICDMTPGNDILYTCIWTPLDEIIVPAKNGELDGALNIKLTAPVEHALILAHEETASYVIPGLDGGGKNDNMYTASPPCYTVCDEPVPVEPDVVEYIEPVLDIVEAPEPMEEVVDAPELALEPAQEVLPEEMSEPELPTVAADEGGKTGNPLPEISTTGEVIVNSEAGAAGAPQALHQLPAQRDSGCAVGTAKPSPFALLVLLLLAVVLRSIRASGATRHNLLP